MLCLTKLLLGPLKRSLDGLFVNFFLGNGVFSQNTHTVAFDLGKPSANGEYKTLSAFGHSQFAVFHLSEKRNMAREYAHLPFRRRNNNGVNRVGKHAGFRGDDFKG